MAINWQRHASLLGECTWDADEVDRQVVRELIAQKAPKLLADLPGKGEGWAAHYAFFARRGFTAEARAEATRRGALLVDPEELAADLSRLRGQHHPVAALTAHACAIMGARHTVVRDSARGRTKEAP